MTGLNHVRSAESQNIFTVLKNGIRDNLDMQKRLLKLGDLPAYLQFNKYIFTGYRPLLDSVGCLMSLLYFHNETINILTHAIPMVFLLFWVPSDLSWPALTFPYSVLPWLHICATVSSWIGSSIYHLFMCHKSGCHTYKKLLQVDMMGIWVTQTFGALTTVTASTYCLSSAVRVSVFVFYCLTCVWGFHKALYAANTNPIDRRLCFLLPISIRVVLLYLRTAGIGGGAPEAIVHVYLQDIIAVIGGAIGALRIPEKWFPGKLDMFFNSHHIMHVLVVIAVIHMHYAAKLDLEWIAEADKTCRP